MKYRIDINCDLGEGMQTGSLSNDAEIMPYVSSCNIACGYHAGSPAIMRECVRLAQSNKVAIGAHPSFQDRENFGRRRMDVPYRKLRAQLCDQISLLQSIAAEQDAVLHHVKPHGALYNAAAEDLELANCIAESIAAVDKQFIFYGLANSKMQQAASNYGLVFAHEAFIDRAYQADGRLLPRSQPNAVLEDQREILARAVQMIKSGTLAAADGTEINVQCDTLCLHGDSRGAVEVAKNLALFLSENRVEIRAVNG